MADLATLGIVVNYKENVNVSKRLKDIQREAGKTEKTTKKLFQSKADKHLAELKKVAKSYSDADRAAKLHWEGINRQTRKVQDDLKKLKAQNMEAFDREDIRLYRKELGATETALRKLKGKIPDREFQRLQHQISQSRRELTKHHTSMNKFNAVTTTATRVTSKFRMALASVAGAAAMGYLIKRNLDAADSIAKTADRLGVTTTLLQEYQYIADKAGVSSQNLEKGLGAFVARMGELKSGRGQLFSFLKDYDEGFADALKSTGSTEEALKMFIDRMAEAKKESHDTAVALGKQGFGRTAGLEMVNMVKNGTESIDELRKRFERLGIAIDEEALRNAEKAKDSLADLTAVIKTRVITVIGDLAPQIGQAAQNTADWIAANKKLLSQDIPKFLGSVTTGMGKLIRATNELITSMQIITKAFYDPAGAAELFRKEMEKTNEEIRNSETIPFVDPRTKKTVEENTKALEGALKVVRGMAKPDEMPAVLDLENLYGILERLNQLWEADALSQEDYFRAIEMYGEKFTDTFEKAGDIAEAEQKQTLKKVSTMWDRTLQNIQDNTGAAFYAEIKNTEEEWENFDAVCDSTFKERSKDLNGSDSIRPERQYIPALQSQAA